MLRTLSRLMLGLVLAIVFAGQAAFASRPCEQMDAPEAVVSAEAAHHAQPCHDEASPPEAGTPAPMTDTTPSAGLCECAALLKTCLGGQPALKTARAEPWSWRAPESVGFASLDLTPDGPPPKA